jgi:hypothetical protein
MAAACLVLLASAAAAQSGSGDMKKAIEKVRRDTGGQVLSANERTLEGRRVIRVKVLDKNGVVRYVDVEKKP